MILKQIGLSLAIKHSKERLLKNGLLETTSKLQEVNLFSFPIVYLEVIFKGNEPFHLNLRQSIKLSILNSHNE